MIKFTKNKTDVNENYEGFLQRKPSNNVTKQRCKTSIEKTHYKIMNERS